MTTSTVFFLLSSRRGALRFSWRRGALWPAVFALALLPACRPEPLPIAEGVPSAVAPGGQRLAPAVASAAPSAGTTEPAAPAEKPFAVSKEQAVAIVTRLSSVVERSAPTKEKPKGLQPQVTVQKEATEHQDGEGRWKSGEISCPDKSPRAGHHEVVAVLLDQGKPAGQESYLVDAYSGAVAVEPGEPFQEKCYSHDDWYKLDKKLSQRTGEIFSLPEVKAFASYLERQSKGTVHATIRPESIPLVGCTGGARCVWEFYVGESHSERTVRWSTFQIDEPTGAISIAGLDGTSVPYAKWRKTVSFR